MPRKDSPNTFICISKKNRDQLLLRKIHYRETYNNVIERLLNKIPTTPKQGKMPTSQNMKE